MDTIGIYEYNSKDLIGHGAFAVVYKGRVKMVRILHIFEIFDTFSYFRKGKMCEKFRQLGRKTKNIDLKLDFLVSVAVVMTIS